MPSWPSCAIITNRSRPAGHRRGANLTLLLMRRLDLAPPDSVPGVDQERAAERVRVLSAAIDRQYKSVAEVRPVSANALPKVASRITWPSFSRGVKAMAALRQFNLDEGDFGTLSRLLT